MQSQTSSYFAWSSVLFDESVATAVVIGHYKESDDHTFCVVSLL